MSDLAIGAAPSLTGAQSASGDLFPVVDVSATAGSKGKSITRDELGDAMTRTAALITALAAKLDKVGGTISAGSKATAGLTFEQTWNSVGTVCRAVEVKVTDTTSASGSTLFRLLGGAAAASERFAVDKDGGLWLNGSSAAVISRRTDINQLNFHGQNQWSTAIGASGAFPGINFGATAGVYWTNDIPASSPDIYLHRAAASILGLKASSATDGAALELHEMTAPSAPSTNRARLYAEDNGSGKTRLMVRFPSGAAQQIAIEP